MRRRQIITTVVGLAVAGVAAFVVSPPVMSADMVEVTTCGQRVRGEAFLTADLDCSMHTVPSGTPYGIIFEPQVRGVLDMRGFSIIGPSTIGAPSLAGAVRCERKCDIFGGGGLITGDSAAVLAVLGVRIWDLTISNTARRAVDGRRFAKLYNVAITGGGEEAVTGDRLLLENCFISNNGLGTWPPCPAVHGHAIRVWNSTVVDNQGVGAEGRRARFRDSVVTGNGVHESCGTTHNCNFDVGSFKKPRLTDTSCNHSFDARACGGCNGQAPLIPENDPSLNKWGICALD